MTSIAFVICLFIIIVGINRNVLNTLNLKLISIRVFVISSELIGLFTERSRFIIYSNCSIGIMLFYFLLKISGIKLFDIIISSSSVGKLIIFIIDSSL